MLVCSFWSFFTPTINFGFSIADPSSNPVGCKESGFGVNLKSDPKGQTFYDDPEMSYSIEKPVKEWDEKRKEWLKHHPSFAAGASERIILVTGSQPKPCKNPIGDHLLLRFFKNKVDYCRIHGYDIFYNNLLLHPKMNSYWAKLPVVKAAMLAHPEAEWIWWVDSDALFTDMEFKLPLQRYKNQNLVVHGWPKLIYNSKSWTSLNAGIFLMRNCQWSMDFINTWSNMGPMSKEYKKWGRIQRSTFKDKLFPESDDQSALVYLLYKEKEKYYSHIYLESQFYFEGYWVEIIGRYENTTEKYLEIERGMPKLRRRHAEKVSEQYGAFREEFLKEAGNGKGSWRRPFITHFTGCQPCSGDHNQMYAGESCWNGMDKALNFADNQVLRNYGFIHPDLQDSSTVTQVLFDYPADEGPW
ncbi:Galactomannan galactosyltransferase 1 [Hibiscus syriacus]|uniref:Galactomannan galactosyltransferase 1 n=2 Tax=Hibiscus syriacus TaxID=106335 RepID=A0A6A2WCE4_HIBSY|nr:Galactomannan galactosyltransferase 1 [Hibiscus syriacus]